MCCHHTGDSGRDQPPEGHQLQLLDPASCVADQRQLQVRILVRITVPGEMFGAAQNAGSVQAAMKRIHQISNQFQVYNFVYM